MQSYVQSSCCPAAASPPTSGAATLYSLSSSCSPQNTFFFLQPPSFYAHTLFFMPRTGKLIFSPDDLLFDQISFSPSGNHLLGYDFIEHKHNLIVSTRLVLVLNGSVCLILQAELNMHSKIVKL